MTGSNSEGIKQGKYYDWSKSNGIALDPARDGCSYETWYHQFENFSFAIHPEGFLVFLPPSTMEGSDEYKNVDPYRSVRLVEDPFHLGRLECTMELAKLCILNEGRGSRILDLGCGEGHFTVKLQEYFPLAEVSGLDYSISAIRRAVQNYRARGIEFIVADACTPPICRDILTW